MQTFSIGDSKTMRNIQNTRDNPVVKVEIEWSRYEDIAQKHSEERPVAHLGQRPGRCHVWSEGAYKYGVLHRRPRACPGLQRRRGEVRMYAYAGRRRAAR